jgi:hypothetical protein
MGTKSLSLRFWAGEFPVHLNGDSGKPAGAAIRFCKSIQPSAISIQPLSEIPNPGFEPG